MKIRVEQVNDYNRIHELVKAAFAVAKHSGGDEQDLIRKLRKSEQYIPELTLVAEVDNEIVGHIMFTKAEIVSEDKHQETLALAPLAVDPNVHNQGIGSQLIREGLRLSRELGYESVVVLGSETYYPKFGFEEASNYGVRAPFKVSSPNFMITILNDIDAKDISGEVRYAKEFFE